MKTHWEEGKMKSRKGVNWQLGVLTRRERRKEKRRLTDHSGGTREILFRHIFSAPAATSSQSSRVRGTIDILWLRSAAGGLQETVHVTSDNFRMGKKWSNTCWERRFMWDWYLEMLEGISVQREMRGSRLMPIFIILAVFIGTPLLGY